MSPAPCLSPWILRRGLGYTYERWQSLGVGFRQGGLDHDDAGCAGRNPKPEVVWDFMRLSFARRASVIVAFGALYCLLMILGLVLRENSQQLTIIWPAAGLLFMALWFSPKRNWIWILAVQMAVELTVDAVRSDHFTWHRYVPYILANSLDAIVGAAIAQTRDSDAVSSESSPRAAIHCGGCARLRGQRRARRREFDGSPGGFSLSA